MSPVAQQLVTQASQASNRRPPNLRGSAQTGLVAAAATTGTITFPTIRVGDILLIVTTSASNGDTIATPAGWNLAFGPVDTTGTGTQCRSYLFTRVADGTEGASVTLTKTGTGAAWRADVSVWGDTAGLGVSASNFSTAANGDSSPVLPSVTPTVPNSTIVGLYAFRANITAVTQPAHWKDAHGPFTGGGNPTIDVAHMSPVPASATGTATASVSSATKWVTFAVELKHT